MYAAPLCFLPRVGLADDINRSLCRSYALWQPDCANVHILNIDLSRSVVQPVRHRRHCLLHTNFRWHVLHWLVSLSFLCCMTVWDVTHVIFWGQWSDSAHEWCEKALKTPTSAAEVWQGRLPIGRSRLSLRYSVLNMTSSGRYICPSSRGVHSMHLLNRLRTKHAGKQPC